MLSHTPITYDFTCMRNGTQFYPPGPNELALLNPYEQLGSHPDSNALLLIHGFGSSPAVFRHFYPHLCHYRYIYAPTLKGHGTSIQNFSVVHYQDWLIQIGEILSNLCQRFETVDVLGLSLGGLIASKLAPQFPIHHLYLLAPALELFKPATVLKQTAKFFKGLGFFAIRNQGGLVHQSQDCELTYRWLPIDSILQVLSLIEEFQYKPWSIPTTLFLGKHDLVVNSNKVAKKLRDLPQLKTIMLQNSAHVLPIDGDYPEIIHTLNLRNVVQPEHKASSTP